MKISLKTLTNSIIVITYSMMGVHKWHIQKNLK